MDYSLLTNEQQTAMNELKELIPLCGCGMPSETMRYVAGILRAIQARSEQWNDERNVAVQRVFDLPLDHTGYNTHPAYWFILYMLDHLRLTDHGSGVGGSWLTDNGQRALALYNELEDIIKADIEE